MIELEYIICPRQCGKTYALAERVADLQDEGHEVAVIVHSAQAVDQWFDLLFEVGIDPSRFMVLLPEHAARKLAGTNFVIAGVDNIDLISENNSRQVEALLGSWPQDVPVVLTSRN